MRVLFIKREWISSRWEINAGPTIPRQLAERLTGFTHAYLKIEESQEKARRKGDDRKHEKRIA